MLQVRVSVLCVLVFETTGPSMKVTLKLMACKNFQSQSKTNSCVLSPNQYFLVFESFKYVNRDLVDILAGAVTLKKIKKSCALDRSTMRRFSSNILRNDTKTALQISENYAEGVTHSQSEESSRQWIAILQQETSSTKHPP
jgi:hypothetical protein